MNNKFIGIVLLSAFMLTAASCIIETSDASDKKVEEKFFFLDLQFDWHICGQSNDTSYDGIDTILARIDKGFEAGFDTLKLKTLRVYAYTDLKQDYATALRYLDQDFPAGAPALMGPLFRDVTFCKINARICKQKGDRANEMNYYRQGYEITKNFLKENRRKFEEYLKIDDTNQKLGTYDMCFAIENYLYFHAAIDPRGFYNEIKSINTKAKINKDWTDGIIKRAMSNYICNDVDSRQQKSNGQNAK